MTKIAALTVPHRFGAISAQLHWIDSALTAASDAALVVLPEAALTGYVSENGDYDLRAFAEPEGGATESALSALAKKHAVALLAPLIERSGTQLFNATALFDKNGVVVFRYRKRHPWMPETWAAPGESPPPFIDFGGLVLTVCICFDIHFLAAESDLRRADVLLFPSAWSEEIDSRPALLGELAGRFALTVVNANWGLGAPRVSGQGESLIVSPSGIVRSNGFVATDI